MSDTRKTGLELKEMSSYVGLKARMKSDKERRLATHRQDSLLDPRAVHVVVLNYHVFLENFHRVELVRSLPLGQCHLPHDRTTGHSA